MDDDRIDLDHDDVIEIVATLDVGDRVIIHADDCPTQSDRRKKCQCVPQIWQPKISD